MASPTKIKRAQQPQVAAAAPNDQEVISSNKLTAIQTASAAKSKLVSTEDSAVQSNASSQVDSFDDVKDELILKYTRELRLGSTNLVHMYKKIEFTNKQDYILHLMESLYAARRADSIVRNTKMAGFPSDKTLADFDPSNLESKISWKTMCSCSFIHDKQGLVLQGNSGTGKTHLSIALGVQACQQGYKVLFYRTSNFIDTLNRAYESNKLEALIKKIDMCDLLILDEFGYIPMNVTGTRLLFEIIAEHIYEKRSLIITTNLPMSEWNQIFSDAHLAQAVVDRVVHHCFLVHHTGESYRLTHSLMAASLSQEEED